MNSELQKLNQLMDKANSFYKEAYKLKEIARKSKENIKTYLEASNMYKEAAKVNVKVAKNLQENNGQNKYNQKANEFIILSEYYYYEAEQCTLAYYLGLEDIEKAKKHYQVSSKHIRNAINLSEKIISNEFFEKELTVWKFFEKENQNLYNSIVANEAWINEDYITALDYYRKSIKYEQDLVDLASNLVKENKLEPVYERIAKSNQIAMLANISSAMCQIIYKNNEEKISEDVMVKLLKLFFECYDLSSLAYSNNPEWKQYKIGSDIYYDNILEILKNHKYMWKNIFIDFKDNTEFLKIMQKLDSDTYRKIEIELSISNNKAFQIWSTRIFWIVTFLIIISSITVIAKSISLSTFIVILAFTYIFFVVIGAFILKSTNSLSEERFLKLIAIVCVNQINVLKIFNRNEENK